MMSDANATEEDQSIPSWISNNSATLEEEQNVSPDDAAPRQRLKNGWKKSATWRAKVGKNVGDIGKKAGPLVKNVGNQLQKVNLARLIDEMEHDQELADKLEFVNQETKEEAARKELVREATEACQKEIEDHLEDFLDRHPDATYEEWIKELHPDNVEKGMLLDEFTVVDLRFYVEDSDHRIIWNNHEKVSEDRFVAARSFKNASSHSQAVDLLDDQTGQTDTAPLSATDGRSDSVPNFTAGTESFEDHPVNFLECCGTIEQGEISS